MSRIIYKNLITIDLISAYSPEIPSDISFFLTGSSSLSDFLSIETAIQEDSLFTVYKLNDSLKLLTDLPRLSNPHSILSYSSSPVFENFRSKAGVSYTIGIMHYNKDQFPQIEQSVFSLISLIENLINNQQDCSITIASLNDFSKKLVRSLKLNSDCQVATYMNNKEMRIDLYDRINCKYCNEIPCVAYITSCCNTLYCENCRRLLKNCFDCGIQEAQLELEPFFTNFLKTVRYKCKCGEEFTCQSIKSHSFCCELTVFRCKKEQCKFEGTQVELVAHVIDAHFDDIRCPSQSQVVGASLRMRECFKCMAYFGENACGRCGEPKSFEEVLDLLALGS